MSDKVVLTAYGVIGWEIDPTEISRTLHRHRNSRIELRLHSPGGYTSDASAIGAAIRRHGDVHVVVDGLAASAASLIAMSARSVTMSADAEMMIHRPWVFAVGEAEDLRKSADHLDSVEDRMVARYVARTGLEEATIREMLAAETWMSAAEAVEFGFADEVGNESGSDNDEVIAAYLVSAETDQQLYSYRHPRERTGQIAAILAAKSPKPSKREEIMENEEEVTTSAGDDVVARATQREITAAAKLAEAEKRRSEERQAIAKERERIGQINALCARHGIPDELRASYIDGGVSLERVNGAILTYLHDTQALLGPSVQVGEDAGERLVQDVRNSLECRLGFAEPDPKNRLIGQPLQAMATFFDPLRGIGGADNAVRRVFQSSANVDPTITHTSSDFPGILAGVAYKSLLQGYAEFPHTHQEWTRTGQMSNFHPAVRTGLGKFADLAPVEEGAQYVSTTLGDTSAQLSLDKYGNTFGITWEAVVNDDLNALTDIPRRFGAAARRTVENKVYGLLEDNVLMPDGEELFHTAHNNGANDLLTKDNLIKAITAMKSQLADGQKAGMVPRYLVVPTELEFTARELLLPAPPGSPPNILGGALEIIVSQALTETARWYVIAGPQNDTAEVAYLNGKKEPEMFRAEGFTIDGHTYKVRMVFGAAVLDYRAFYRGGVAPAS